MSARGEPRLLGVVSDTHGHLHEGALPALAGSELIIHAGDVGRPEILDALRRVAPLVAVRGNVDVEPWAEVLSERELVEFGDHALYVLHDLEELDVDPEAMGVSLVVHGHSHKPGLFTRRGVTYLNPGSVGPRRFRLPVALARVRVGASGLEAELVTLEEF